MVNDIFLSVCINLCTNYCVIAQNLNKFTIYGTTGLTDPSQDNGTKECYTSRDDFVFPESVTRSFVCENPVVTRYVSGL